MTHRLRWGIVVPDGSSAGSRACCGWRNRNKDPSNSLKATGLFGGLFVIVITRGPATSSATHIRRHHLLTLRQTPKLQSAHQP